MTAPNWLAEMPAIPLARAVPVVHLTRSALPMVVLDPPNENDDAPVIALCFGGRGGQQVSAEYLKDLRVDLSDQQGFSYALRWALAQDIDLIRYFRLTPDETRKGIESRIYGLGLRDWVITDADRLALARACRAVVEAK